MAGPTRVQTKSNYHVGAASSSTLTITLDSAPKKGNLLVLVIGCIGLGESVASVAQNSGTVTWAQQKESDDGNGQYVFIWTGAVVGSAGTGINITLGAASYVIEATACEYNNVLISSFIDVTGSANSGIGGGTTGDTGAAGPTNQAVEVWVGGIWATGVSVDPTQSNPTSGWALLDGAQHYYYSSIRGSTAYLEKIVSATGTAECTDTIANSGEWAGAIICIKGAVPVTYTTTYLENVLLKLTNQTVTNKLDVLTKLTNQTHTYLEDVEFVFRYTKVFSLDAIIGHVLTGVTVDSNGSTLASCTVLLFETSGTGGNPQFIASTTSDANGIYYFVLPNNSTQYFVEAIKTGIPHVFGTTDRNLTAT